MNFPEELSIHFQYKDADYNVTLSKGQKSDQSVKINQTSYTVMGDREITQTLCKILSSIPLEGVSSVKDFVDRLSICKDLLSPSAEATDSLGVKVLDQGTEGSLKKIKIAPDEELSPLSHEVTPFNQQTRQALELPPGNEKLPTLVATSDLATHHFLEQSIGSAVLSSAHQVVNSLNKDIINIAPLNEAVTKQLEENFVSTLPSFGVVKQEPEIIKLILNQKIGIEHFHVRQFFEGGSGANVYGIFVPDEKGELSYVVKTMEGRTSELARELSSLQILSDLNLRQSVLPTAKSAGQFRLESNNALHTIFVQTAAKGKPFHSIMDEVGKLTGQMRAQKLEEISRGLKSASKALAELHLKNKDQATPLGNEAKAFNLNFLTEWRDLIKRDLTFGDRIPLKEDQLMKIYEKAVQSVENHWGLSGYSHGDTHLENLFFDATLNQFTFIDTSSFLTSIDDKNRPIGFPAYDFAWTMGSISDKGFRAGLSEKEVEALQNTFSTEYTNIMGEALAPKEARQLAALTKQFYFIRRANQNQEYILDFKSQIPDAEEQLQRLQRLIDYEVKAITS